MPKAPALLALLLLLLSTFAATGCGPTLRFVDRDPDGFRVHAGDGGTTCSQGPFLIERKAIGERWGESLQLRVHGPRPLAGAFELRLGDRILRRGHWRTGHSEPAERNTTRWVVDRQVDNQHCLERPTVVVAEGPAPPEQEQSPQPQQQPQQQQQQEQQQLPGPPPRVHGPAVLEPTPPYAGGQHHTTITQWHIEHRRVEGSAGITAGTPIQIWIWSTEPIDWGGAVFVLSHAAAKPSVSEAEWIAHLQAEKRERARELAEERAEAERAARKRAVATRPVREKAAARRRFCAEHRQDEGCWGKGGYDAHVQRQQRAREQRRLEAEVEREAWRVVREVREEDAAIIAYVTPEPERVCHPTDPPPPAQAEVLPPQPTPHSRWVAGYWIFTCEGWFWLEGWWKVPESDLRAEVVVAAPAAPPPVQVEARPPCPVVGAVWVVGHWLWIRGAWVWVRGRWALPPSRGVVWRGGIWIPLPGGGVRLDPGRWEVRVRVRR